MLQSAQGHLLLRFAPLFQKTLPLELHLFWQINSRQGEPLIFKLKLINHAGILIGSSQTGLKNGANKSRVLLGQQMCV